jgi:hypothetical protein
MSVLLKRTLCIAAVALIGLAFGRAASFRFQEKTKAIYDQCRAELAKLGITRDQAKVKYFTPEISMVSAACLPPGGTGQVVIKGKFAPGTKFVFENDNIETVTESLAGGEYRATVKAAPGIGPQSAGVVAITPVTGLSVRHDRVASVGGKYEWIMDAANGWRIVANSTGAGCAERGAPHEVRFFRKGESAPFEKRAATLHHSVYERENFNFDISEQDAATQSQADDMQALVKQMTDPNLSDAQREQVMKKVEVAQQRMMAGVQKMANPDYARQLQAQRDQFGCSRIFLQEQGGSLTGRLRCSDKVGTQIGLTGAVKYLGR